MPHAKYAISPLSSLFSPKTSFLRGKKIWANSKVHRAYPSLYAQGSLTLSGARTEPKSVTCKTWLPYYFSLKLISEKICNPGAPDGWAPVGKHMQQAQVQFPGPCGPKSITKNQTEWPWSTKNQNRGKGNRFFFFLRKQILTTTPSSFKILCRLWGLER